MIGSHRMCETWRFTGRAVEVGEVDAFRRQNGHVAVGQEKHVARVAQDRGHVRGDEVLAIAETDDNGRTETRRHNLVRVAPGDHGQREYSRQLFHRAANRIFQVPVEILLDEVRDDLGIGLGDEFVTLGLSCCLSAR